MIMSGKWHICHLRHHFFVLGTFKILYWLFRDNKSLLTIVILLCCRILEVIPPIQLLPPYPLTILFISSPWHLSQALVTTILFFTFLRSTFWLPYINENMQYLSFVSHLLHLAVPSSSIHVSVSDRISFFFMVE